MVEAHISAQAVAAAPAPEAKAGAVAFNACGLPNVLLAGTRPRDGAVDIPCLTALLNEIAASLCVQPFALAGAEIRFLRKRIGLSSTEYAQALGISLEQLSRWEHGKARPGTVGDRLVRLHYLCTRADSDPHADPTREPDANSWLKQITRQSDPQPRVFAWDGHQWRRVLHP